MLLIFLVKGIVVGAVIAVPVGPVGILCLRKTIFEGRLAGLVFRARRRHRRRTFSERRRLWPDLCFGLAFRLRRFAACGGRLSICSTLAAVRFLPPPPQDAKQSDPETLFRDFVSTFALTVTNPITILVFLGVFGVLGLSGARATLLRAGVLVAGVWAGSFLWWLALSLGIGTFRRSIGRHHLAWISRGSGAAPVFCVGRPYWPPSVVKELVHLV